MSTSPAPSPQHAASHLSAPTLRRSALLIIYTFPPVGGAGVQRAVKFGRYLPDSGWKPVFLTVKDVVYHVYDPALIEELSPHAEVIRTESADPLRLMWRAGQARRSGGGAPAATRPSGSGSIRTTLGGIARRLYAVAQRWVFVVDPQLLWLPFATIAGVRAVRDRHIDVVVAMPQPSSVALTGYLIARITGRPLVIDMRDPWTQCPYFRMPTALHRRVNNSLERRVFSHAAHLIVISASMRDAIIAKYPLLADRVSLVTNGFDSADLASAIVAPPDGRFVLTYTGSLYAHHTPVFRSVCEAIARLLRRRPELRKKLLLRIVGRIDVENVDVIGELGLSDVCVATGYLPHNEAIGYTLAADALLLIIKSDLDPTKQVVTIPGKVFEYIATKKPILFIGPESETSQMLKATGQGRAIPDIPDAIEAELERLIGLEGHSEVDATGIGRYERKHLTARFAAILDNVVDAVGQSAERLLGRG